MKLRRLGAFVAAAALTGALSISAAAAAPVQMTFNGTPVEFVSGEAFIHDNYAMVPMRDAAEALGLQVEWDDRTRSAVFFTDYLREDAPEVVESEDGTDYLTHLNVSMTIGESRYLVTRGYSRYDESGSEIRYQEKTTAFSMDTAAIIQNNRTYAPAAALAEAFGYDVIWDGDSRTVMVEYPQVAGWDDALLTVERDGEPSGEWVLAVYNVWGAESIAVTDAALATEESTGTETTVVHLQPLTEAEATTLAATSPDLAEASNVQMYWITAEDLPRVDGNCLIYRIAYTKFNGVTESVLRHVAITEE